MEVLNISIHGFVQSSMTYFALLLAVNVLKEINVIVAIQKTSRLDRPSISRHTMVSLAHFL